MKAHPLLPALALLCGLAAATPLLALDEAGTVTTQDLMGGEDPRLEITLKQARERVLAETGGRLLSAKTIRLEGVFVHRIVVRTPQGEELTYDIDAGLVQ